MTKRWNLELITNLQIMKQMMHKTVIVHNCLHPVFLRRNKHISSAMRIRILRAFVLWQFKNFKHLPKNVLITCPNMLSILSILNSRKTLLVTWHSTVFLYVLYDLNVHMLALLLYCSSDKLCAMI